MLKQCLENIGEGLLHACISSIITYTVLTCVLNSRLVDALMGPLVRVAFAFFFVGMMFGHLRPFYCFLCLICFIYACFMLCFSFLSVMNSAVVVLLFAHLVFDLVLSCSFQSVYTFAQHDIQLRGSLSFSHGSVWRSSL